MKKKTIITAILFTLFFLPHQLIAKPKTLIDNPVFTFESLPEGIKIPHEFIIKNTGDTLLRIEKVLPPWGCDKSSFDKEIPPGGEGKINVSFKTDGYGGKTMKKVIRVKTDDPEKKEFNLIVTGLVERVVDIKPVYVYLTGKQGDTLETVVTITPAEKYLFSILEMTQKINTKIHARLIEPEGDKKSWQTSDKPEQSYDVLTLKTDSRYKPTLTIRVYVNFLKKKESKS